MTTPTELKIGRQARDLQARDITIGKRAEGDDVVRLSFSASSEAPVERWYGTEVLSHESGAVDMVRIAGGAAPLLFNHDWNDPIGMIDSARLSDGRLLVEAHLFATARAAEIATMVEGGLRNVSIGYQVDEMTEEVKAERYTATRWTPLEVSIVTVPADTTVGIGRAAEQDARPVRLVRTVSEPAAMAAAQPKEVILTQATNAAAGTNADPTAGQRLTAQDAENQRREAIRSLAEANKIDGRVEQSWVENGTSLHEIAREILEVQVQRQQGAKYTAAALGLSNKEAQRYSLFKAIRAMHYGARDSRVLSDAAFELECSREVAKKLGRGETMNFLVPAEVLSRPLGAEVGARVMTATPGGKGGYMVGVDNLGFIDILRNRSVAMNMGARNLPGLVGNVSFARQTGKATVAWQGGEGSTVTATDQALGMLSMTPKTAICITDVSEQLLRQATPSAEAFVMADLAANIAIDGVDAAVINGAGGAAPLGIRNTPGVTTGQDASSLTYAKALAFPGAAAAVNAVLGNPGFITNAAGAIVAMQRQRFTSTDTPIWDGNMMDGTLVGFRAMSSEQVASGNLIFGSWSEVLIGDWGVLELAMDNGGTRFNQGLVGIRAMWMVDVLVRYPQAFVVGANLS